MYCSRMSSIASPSLLFSIFSLWPHRNSITAVRRLRGLLLYNTPSNYSTDWLLNVRSMSVSIIIQHHCRVIVWRDEWSVYRDTSACIALGGHIFIQYVRVRPSRERARVNFDRFFSSSETRSNTRSEHACVSELIYIFTKTRASLTNNPKVILFNVFFELII